MPRAQQVKSKDPVQQQLRDHKRKWSDDTSALISKIIAFKRGLNGRGDAKLGLPPSAIKEALPTEIGSFLGQLTSEFQDIVRDAESIIQQQEAYSKNRRQKQPKQPKKQVVPAAKPQADELVNTLSRLGSDADKFEKYASNKITRVWQYLNGVFSRKEFNRQRLGLLSQCADLLHSLEDFENAILSLKISSMPSSIGKYKDFKYNFDAFNGTYKGVVAMVEKKANTKLPEQEEQKKPEITPSSEEVKSENAEAQKPSVEKQQKVLPVLIPGENQPNIPESIKKIKQDLHYIFNETVLQSDVKDLLIEVGSIINDYEIEEDPLLANILEDQVKNSYSNLLKMLSNSVQKKYGPANINSLQDIINHIHKNKTASTEQNIVKNSHNAMTRFLKKKLVKTLTSNKTSAIRLGISETIAQIYDILENMMNNLEKDLSIKELDVYVSALNELVAELKSPLHTLNTYYMKDFFSKKERNTKSKNYKPDTYNDPLYQDVIKRRLKRDLNEDL